MKLSRRRTLGAAAALALAPDLAWAQAFPSKPIRLIVPYSAGGGADTTARLIAPKLQEALGQTVVVENKPGAGGMIGDEIVAKAAPDGQTLLLSFTSHAINATLYPKLPFDPVKDFTALTCVATSPSILVASPSLPMKDVRELIALAKAKPGQLNFAIGAVGSSLHMAGEAFKMQAGVDIVNIPYKGTAPAVQDLLAGQVQLMFAAVGNVKAHIQAGKLKPLAVGAPARLDSLPQVPTLAELGQPAANLSSLFGIYAPAQTPAAVLARINAEVNKALALPDIRSKLEATDNVPTGGTAAEFARQIAQESENNARIIRAAGIQASN
eukprot:gene41340-biopygen33106